MKGYISENIVAVYVTDADGVPTEANIRDWQGVSLLNGDTPSPPNAFDTNQWSLATGSSPREITINVSVLPANNGAAITGIDYSIDDGAWVALAGAGTGPRTITAAAAGTSYSIRLRAVNAVGAGAASTAKSVTSGAALSSLTATLSPNPPVAGQVLTITFSAAPDTVTATLDGSAITVSGSGTEYSVTPATVGELIVTATKAGFDGYTDTLTVFGEGQTPEMTVTIIDGETQIDDATGDITFVWSDPVEYAGTHTNDQSAEYSGTLNGTYTTSTAPQCVVAPTIARVSGTSDQVSSVYRMTVPEALIYESDNGLLTVMREWLLDGVATGVSGDDDYAPETSGDVTLRVSVTQPGMEARSILSNAITVTEAETRSFFIAADGTSIANFADPAGRTFTYARYSTPSVIQNNYLRCQNPVNYPRIATSNVTAGQAQWAKVWVKAPPTTPADWAVYSLLCAVGTVADSNTSVTDRGYGLIAGGTGLTLIKKLLISGTSSRVNLASSGPDYMPQFTGQDITFELRRSATNELTVYVNDVLVPQMTVTDTEYTDGNPGLCDWKIWPSAEMDADFGTYAWDGGDL